MLFWVSEGKFTKCRIRSQLNSRFIRSFPPTCPSFLLCLQLLASAGSYDLRLDEYRDLVLKCWSKFYGCCHEYQRVKFKVHSSFMGCIASIHMKHCITKLWLSVVLQYMVDAWFVHIVHGTADCKSLATVVNHNWFTCALFCCKYKYKRLKYRYFKITWSEFTRYGSWTK